MSKTVKPSPKEFLKSRRPEQYSSSIEVESGQLDRAQLEYYLSTLNTRSQELEFETFAKQLCEKIICPNLLQQTGPVAGGDGKTDTQTFPVSEQNKILWYEGINDASHKERWAFAVSTQKAWKVKCNKDVKKIVQTNRGYTKVICITNQSIKSNQRSDLEDSLSKEFDIQVQLLDLSWILDQIYKNKLEYIAINTLNIPTLYKREIELSADDYKKQKEFDRLNNIITEGVDAHKILISQVGYFLELAILSKELEKPIIETQGLFDRAVRVATKFGSNQQILEAYYQYAWAAHGWFEDYTLFENNLEGVYKTIVDSTNVSKWENLITLIIAYIGCYKYLGIKPEINMDLIISSTREKLGVISTDDSRPSNALKAKISLCLLNLIDAFGENKDVTPIFSEVLEICLAGEGLIGFPFERTYNLFSDLDSIFDENEEYERLLDFLNEQFSKRCGETKASQLSLNRGVKRLESGKPYQAIKLIGKALIGLNKEESCDDITFASFALSAAYDQVGLRWASRACLLLSSSLLTDRFHRKEEMLSITVKSYLKLAWRELELGRIPQSLKWYELVCLTVQMIENECIEQEELSNFDGCLSHLLANCSIEELKELEFLPDQLNNLGLFCSYGTLLYVLGYEKKFQIEFEFENIEIQYDTLLMLRDTDIKHPSSKILKTLGRANSYTTKVLGCVINIKFPNRSPLVELAESLLATLESFFATGLIDKIYTKSAILNITLVADDDDNNFISHEFKNSSLGGYFEVFCSNFTWESLTKEKHQIISEWFYSFIFECLAKAFMIKDLESTLEQMIKDDLALSRSISFSTCFGTVYNIMGRNAYKDTIELLDGSKGNRYELKRKLPWDNLKPKIVLPNTNFIQLGDHKNKPDFDDTEEIRHDQIGVTTLIKPDLWNAAKWNGLGFIIADNKPPMLMLIFTEPESGYNVFMSLYNELGGEDKLEKLRVSIIRRISKDSPSHYRVQLGDNILENNQLKRLIMINRIHEMKPANDNGWVSFEKALKQHGGYLISFGAMVKGQFHPHPDFEELSIYKKQIVVKDAWEVGVNNIEQMSIRKDDDPYVPDGVIAPPYLEVIKTRFTTGI